MKHIWFTALLVGCIALATLAIAAEPHNSHPADGDPLITLNFQSEDFTFTDVEIRELRDGTGVSWSLKGFLARQGTKRPVPFSVVLSQDGVTRANQQWSFGDENPNILAVLKEIGAVTHFDLAPIDAAERTVLIEDVNHGMSGRVEWSGPLDKRFGELVPGARSPGRAAAFLANAFFTFIEFPEQVEREGSRVPTFRECFENAERACSKPGPNGAASRVCMEAFGWSSDGSCSFSCKTRRECFGAQTDE